MNIDTVITQIRAYCEPLGGRVGGAADFDTGVQSIVAFTDPATGGLAYPSAIVIPLDDEAQDLDPLMGPQLNQMVTERIGIIVEFDAKADRRGQAGVDQVQAMRYALHGAILNWNPDTFRSTNGLRYGGGRLIDFDRARLFWQFEYTLVIQLTDGDGFPLSGDAPISLRGTIPGDGPYTPPIIFEVDLPTE
jgi:hypothetical protein